MNKKVMSLVAIIALIAMLTVCLVACNADTYKKKLDKADYVIAEPDLASIKQLGIEDYEWIVFGTKGTDFVYVIKFEDKNDAKETEENIKGLSTVLKIFNITKVERMNKILFVGSDAGVDVVK